ncbi:hypothetical protein T4D_13929 [Trichinella pseudospiralis]|uniref:Uncharacterized protein n=1 Tax=Trichinella pseudospiralis TaxID=6337 RepID=A0A0V1FJ14_TRIPS|nr:hypothetical protein T4D_13929 [Trichinella pseudospiralis]
MDPKILVEVDHAARPEATETDELDPHGRCATLLARVPHPSRDKLASSCIVQKYTKHTEQYFQDQEVPFCRTNGWIRLLRKRCVTTAAKLPPALSPTIYEHDVENRQLLVRNRQLQREIYALVPNDI